MDNTDFPLTDPPASGSEWVRIAIIFGVLVLLVLIPLLRWRHHETHRPTLIGARVVAATADDPVFRTEPRDVASAEGVRLAVALHIDTPGRGQWWLAPVEHLEIDGAEVEHTVADEWPESDRVLRVFWFSHECAVLGGSIDDATVSQRLDYRKFLAPELGQDLLATGEPAFHGTDTINLGDDIVPTTAGTYRLSVRVEVVADASSIRPLQSTASVDSPDPENAAVLRISRSLPESVLPHPEAGRLFRLPGFQPVDGTTIDMVDLSRRRLATSSRVFASLAATGSETLDPTSLVPVGSIRLDQLDSGHTLRWGPDVTAGDVLRQGDRWLVLVSDDGNGVVDGPDLVAYCYRRPPAVRPLEFAVDDVPGPIEVSRPTRP